MHLEGLSLRQIVVLVTIFLGLYLLCNYASRLPTLLRIGGWIWWVLLWTLLEGG